MIINQLNQKVITNGSMAASLASAAIPTNGCSAMAVQFIWTGTSPVGTVNVLISNDGINFDLLGTAVSVSGNTGNKVIPIVAPGYKFIQAVYTFTSGVGTLNALVSGNGVE